MPVPVVHAALIVLIAAPLAGALAAFVLGGRWGAWLALATAPLMLAAAAALTWGVWQGGPQIYSLGNWPAPLGIELRADGLACAMLLMTAAVGSIVSLYALGYFDDRASPAQTHLADSAAGVGVLFWPFWLMLWGALDALFLSADLFNLYVTLELMTLAAVGLVILAGSRLAVAAALRYLLAALTGSLLYLAGVALLYGVHGTLDLGALGREEAAGLPLSAALLLVTAGLMMKTALFPLHFWLPPAHSSAPAPASALLSGLVVKGSYYVLLRLWFDVFPPETTQPLGGGLALLGAAAILWGALQALFAERLKMLVAYSTVSQLGYLFVVFALADRGAAGGFAAWSAAVLFALSHAFAKSAYFLAAGTVLHVAGHDRIADLSAVSRRLPTTFFAAAIASVSLMGLPPSASFVAKWTLLRHSLAAGQGWLAVVIVAGGLIAAVYLFRVLAAPFTKLDDSETISFPGRPQLLQRTALALALLSLLLAAAASPTIELLRIGSPWSSVSTPAPLEPGP